MIAEKLAIYADIRRKHPCCDLNQLNILLQVFMDLKLLRKWERLEIVHVLLEFEPPRDENSNATTKMTATHNNSALDTNHFCYIKGVSPFHQAPELKDLEGRLQIVLPIRAEAEISLTDLTEIKNTIRLKERANHTLQADLQSSSPTTPDQHISWMTLAMVDHDSTTSYYRMFTDFQEAIKKRERATDSLLN